VMFHGRLSAPLEAAEATREKLGLLMGGANPERLAEEREACSWCLNGVPNARR
jgi:general nucleoside transport system ATP-binding protein